MDNQPKPLGTGLRVLAYLAFGILVGIVGADAFARAVGASAIRELPKGEMEAAIALRVVLGLVLAFTSMIFAAVAVHLVSGLAARLAAAPQRPGLAMSIVMMACGSVCVLLSLIFYWWLAAASTITITAGNAVEISKQTSPLTHLIAVGTFVVGVAMLALGIWGSTGGRARRVHEPVPPVYTGIDKSDQ